MSTVNSSHRIVSKTKQPSVAPRKTCFPYLFLQIPPTAFSVIKTNDISLLVV